MFCQKALWGLLDHMLQETAEVVFSVFDLDLTTAIESYSDVVDHVIIYPDVQAVSSAGGPFSDHIVFNSSAGYSYLELAFRLTCEPPLYGPDCTYCVPSNDSVSGHYSCDNRTGEKVCLEGPGTNCTDCAPASDCSE